MKHDPSHSADKKPQSSFARAFAKSSRKRLSTAILGVALISGCATTFEGASPAKAAVPAADTATTLVQNRNVMGVAPAKPAEMSEQEIQRRNEIRSILIMDAQMRYPELAEKAQNAYSQELKTLQTQLTDYLKRGDTAMHNAIVILDPAKIDVAVAIGVPLAMVIQHEALKHGKLPDGSLANSAAPNAAQTFRAESGVTTYTQNPSAYPNMDNAEAQPCLIIPASDHAYPFTIPGFTHAQKIEFTNTHEGWHCLDSRYRMTAEQMEALKKGNPNSATELATSPNLLIAAAVIHHKETVADVAALGDMVRRGHGTELIDHAIRWRQENVRSDYLHYSVPALQALKAEITSQGIDAFRAQSADAARDTYFRITDENALNPQRLQAMALYVAGSPEVRTLLSGAAAEIPDIAKGIAYAQEVLKPAPAQQPMRDIIAALTPPDMALRQALVDWKPLDKLEQTAFAHGGKLTPETLVHAYGTMQTDLHRELTGEDPRLAREKMTLLKGIFTRYLRTVDYVAANEKFGVDIEAAEQQTIARVRAVVAAAQAARAAPEAGSAATPSAEAAPAGKAPGQIAGTPPARPELNIHAGHDHAGHSHSYSYGSTPKVTYRQPRP